MVSDASRTVTRSTALAGVVGPLLFAVVVIVTGALRPDYGHLHQFISELGESGGDYAWLMNYFGFMLCAGLILIFVVSLPGRFGPTLPRLLGTLFLVLFALGMFFAGVFSCDTGCSPSDPTTEQKMHDLVSLVAFPAFVLGVAIWGVVFLRTAGWRRFGLYSLASAGLAVIAMVLMVQSEATRAGTGIYQRLFLAVLFCWLIVLSIRLEAGSSARSGGRASSPGSR